MRRNIETRFRNRIFPAVAALSVFTAGFMTAPDNVQRAVAAVIPSKSSLSPASIKNWGLANTKSIRSHIQALDAWKIEEGNRKIVVAVIDTGIDPNHKDLATNLWKDTSKGLQPLPGREKHTVPPSAVRVNAADAKESGLSYRARLLRQKLALEAQKKNKNKSAKQIREAIQKKASKKTASSASKKPSETASKKPSETASKKATYGWDFVTNTPNPGDDHGHGTHVAGIIGAVANPDAGVSGVAHKVSIMAVKYFSSSNSGSTNLANTVKAINYAVEKGAKIINYSGGGEMFSEAEYLAMKKAEARGVLFVAAAGNNHQDTDKVEHYYYPAAYGLSNVISVAATDINNNLLESSNWGKQKVDVAAPGENIYSTLPGGKYGYMSGTSQATAFVSGMAALLLAKDPTLTPVQLKKLIVGSVDRLPQLANKVAAGGRVNAYSALLALQRSSKPATELLARSSEAESLSFAEALGF